MTYSCDGTEQHSFLEVSRNTGVLIWIGHGAVLAYIPLPDGCAFSVLSKHLAKSNDKASPGRPCNILRPSLRSQGSA